MAIYIASNTLNSYFNVRMLQELKKFTKKIEIFDPYGADIPIDSVDYILWRTTGINYDDSDLLKYYLKCKILNPPETLILLRDKYKTFNALKNHLPLNPSISLDTYFKDPQQLNMQDLINNKHAVIKTFRGNQGHGVFFIKDLKWWDDFLKKCIEKKDFKFLLQPKLEGEEFRLFLIKGEKPIILKRVGDGEKANFHQNGSAVLVETSDFDYLTQKVEQSIDYIYLAIDLIVANSNPIIIDINGVCGIEQLELVSNQNIALKIIEKINSTICLK